MFAKLKLTVVYLDSVFMYGIVAFNPAEHIDALLTKMFRLDLLVTKIQVRFEDTNMYMVTPRWLCLPRRL